LDLGSNRSDQQNQRAALLGFAAGLRSQIPFAHLIYAVDQGELSLGQSSLDRWLRHPRAVQIATISAIGEMVGDKLPFAPPRTTPTQFLGRLMFGAIAGSIGARSLGGPLGTGAAIGAVAAGMSTFLGTTLRQTLPRLTGRPDAVFALAEDAIAHLLAHEALASTS
jgi:uncharacterized membrane protein